MEAGPVDEPLIASPEHHVRVSLLLPEQPITAQYSL